MHRSKPKNQKNGAVSKKKSKHTKTQNEKQFDRLHSKDINEILLTLRGGITGPKGLASERGKPVEKVEAEIEGSIRDHFLSRLSPSGIVEKLEYATLESATDLMIRGMWTGIRDPRFKVKKVFERKKERNKQCVPIYRRTYLMGPEIIEHSRIELNRLHNYDKLFSRLEIAKRIGTSKPRIVDFGSSVGQLIPTLERLGYEVMGLESCREMQKAAPKEIGRKISIQCVSDLDLPVRHFHGATCDLFSDIPPEVIVDILVRTNRSLKFGALVMLVGKLNINSLGEYIREITQRMVIPGANTEDTPEDNKYLLPSEVFDKLDSITGFSTIMTDNLKGEIDPNKDTVLYMVKKLEIPVQDARNSWYVIAPEYDNCM